MDNQTLHSLGDSQEFLNNLFYEIKNTDGSVKQYSLFDIRHMMIPSIQGFTADEVSLDKIFEQAQTSFSKEEYKQKKKIASDTNELNALIFLPLFFEEIKKYPELKKFVDVFYLSNPFETNARVHQLYTDLEEIKDKKYNEIKSDKKNSNKRNRSHLLNRVVLVLKSDNPKSPNRSLHYHKVFRFYPKHQKLQHPMLPDLFRNHG